MQLTNNTTSATVELPNDLEWVDEFAWSSVVQSTEYSITGALVIDQGVKAAGRPITLQAGDGYAWMTRGAVKTLQAWRQAPGLQMTLALHGVNRVVMFDHERAAIESKPVFFFSDAADTDFCVVTLRFIEV